jgi:hypothetical protein
MKRYRTIVVLASLLALSQPLAAAAIDDLKIDVSHDLCEAGGAGAGTGAGAGAKRFIIYATNLNATQAIDANFKYDSVPAQQHFILFDAGLNPITDRFPKFHARRLAPRETAAVGCTATYRASPQAPGPLIVPLIVAKQSAAYAEPSAPEAAEDARAFAAFYLQGGGSECAPGMKPPGLFYLLNLHPYARLNVSMNLDDRGARVGAVTPNLAPLSAARVGCSNGVSKPGLIIGATLEVTAGAAATLPDAAPPRAEPAPPEHNESQPAQTPALAPLVLGAISRTQNVCAGSMLPGWIKVNDAWNPTVCGKPATLSYNVWTIQELSDQPIDAVVHACKGAVPSGWVIVGTGWNPTICGHPATNQSNVMAIKRLN